MALPVSPLPDAARAGLLVALALTAVVLVPAAESPARADALPAVTVSEVDVAAAQARVADAGRLVERVTEQLTEGTARWEAGTAALQRARAEAARAQARADDAERAAQARRSVLGGFVAAHYRSPVTAPRLLLAGGGPAGLTQALRAEADLRQVQGSQQEALLGAEQAGRAADAAERDAQDSRDRAAARERALAADLAQLKALAGRTSDELTQAMDALDRLEQQRADEIARREAARLTAEEAARARAAAEQAAREAAARAAADRAARDSAARDSAVPAAPAARAAVAPEAGTPGCSGRSTGGYANGTIPASALCPLAYAPGHRLRADAAQGFARLTQAARASRGAPLCVTDSYRSYAEQVRLYQEKPGLAAVPGTSNHGLGVAVDLCGGVESYGTAAYQWMKANAPRFGWVHPAWAEPGGSKHEPWHWEFVG